MSDPFDDAIERMHNAMRAAHAAFLDADAALTIALQAERAVTREKGSIRETVERLQDMIMDQGVERRALRDMIEQLQGEIRALRNGRAE